MGLMKFTAKLFVYLREKVAKRIVRFPRQSWRHELEPCFLDNQTLVHFS